jgi:hypothetical protein
MKCQVFYCAISKTFFGELFVNFLAKVLLGTKRVKLDNDSQKGQTDNDSQKGHHIVHKNILKIFHPSHSHHSHHSHKFV